MRKIKESENIITDLYIELRKKINYWASITKQTSSSIVSRRGTCVSRSAVATAGIDLVIGSDPDRGLVPHASRQWAATAT